MGWIERDANKHKHDTPKNGDSQVVVGDRWQCECGKIFKVTAARREYDQRDHSSWTVLEWAEEPITRSSYPDPPYFGPYGYGSQDR